MLIAPSNELKRRRPWWKKPLPTSLFGRALLILLVPVITLQLSVAYTFYTRHWDSVVRNMSASAAADIALLVDEYRELSKKMGHAEALHQVKDRANTLAIGVNYIEEPKLRLSANKGRSKFPEFFDLLIEHINGPMMIAGIDENTIRIRTNAEGGVIDFTISRKRLASSTTVIFLLWMTASALLLTVIAVLFLRNQIRPIVQLARAAEQFGMGREVVQFSPSGANEVRRAGRAFLVMAERITRQVTSRTEMLAGISHDLRTPLTRMMLELEMSGLPESKLNALRQDVQEMQQMIDEYLDFARGDSGEPMVPVELSVLLDEIVSDYRRQKQKVTLGAVTPMVLKVRPLALRRVLSNLIDNALRYGNGEARVAMDVTRAYVRLKVTDNGRGIAPADMEEVFKPFTRLEPSRNTKTGGVGLGLAVARSIAQSHGGEILLENLYNERGEVMGLEATLRLPREMQPDT